MTRIGKEMDPVEALERVYERDQVVYFVSRKKMYSLWPDHLECQVVMYDTEDMDVELIIDMNEEE